MYLSSLSLSPFCLINGKNLLITKYWKNPSHTLSPFPLLPTSLNPSFQSPVPILGIPFVITANITILVAYVLTVIGFCPIVCISVPWTTPPILFGFLATGANIMGAVTQAILIVVSTVIYTPFLLAYEKYQNKQAAEA